MPSRPLATLPHVSCDDACHKNRGSLGGTDYAVGLGTPVYAMFSGMARYRVAGTGGWTISIERDVDHQVGELMHLSRANGFVLGGARLAVTEGDLVAWSGGVKGAPGSGSATGPHLHAHVYVNGTRYGMEEYLANPDWAGGGTPITMRKRDLTMPALIKRTGGTSEWSLVWPALAGPTSLERGYIVTTDAVRAKWWARFYETGQGSEDQFDRNTYVEAQANARLDHSAWLLGQTAPVVIDYTKLAAAVKIPTLAEIATAVNDDAAARLKA